MTLLLKGSSHHSPTIRRPCCDFSHWFDSRVVESRQKVKLLWMAIALLSSLFIAELLTGLFSHSLSLLADAGHLLSDIIALIISLVATKLAQKPASGNATFGHRRVEILAALGNGLALLAIAFFIAKEAICRFNSPETVLGLPMLIVAGVGLIINGINLTLLHKASHNDLNLRGAFLHVVTDTISSVGVIIAALVVYYCHWNWVDAVVSLAIAFWVSWSALPLVKDSLNVLMEYAPPSLDPNQLETYLLSFDSVYQVEKLQIWTIGSGQIALCAHLIVDANTGGERDSLVKRLQTHLEQEFNIYESTIQTTQSSSTEIIELHPLFNRSLIETLNRLNSAKS
jgi:cobalt-zinc-cadmium efflux system protein